MSRSPIVIAPGLTLDGIAIAFAGHGTDLETGPAPRPDPRIRRIEQAQKGRK